VRILDNIEEVEKRLSHLTLRLLDKFLKEAEVMNMIRTAGWGTVKRDACIYVANDFEDFLQGRAEPYHFAGLINGKFVTFVGGKSLATGGHHTCEWDLALPENDYKPFLL
jgi:hypothetical protein